MNDTTFGYIWDNIIIPTIKRVSDQCSEYNVVSGFMFKTRPLNRLYHQVICDYDKIKQQLKKRYYKSEGLDNETNLIDTHKIASCLCYSLVYNKPFSFTVKENMPKELFLCNYSAAYYASIGFVYASLIAEYRINGYTSFAEKLQGYGKIYEPPVSIGHNTYHEGRIYALAQNDIYGNTFDILAYADMMYWLEMYTRQKIEVTVDPVSLDRVRTTSEQ